MDQLHVHDILKRLPDAMIRQIDLFLETKQPLAQQILPGDKVQQTGIDTISKIVVERFGGQRQLPAINTGSDPTLTYRYHQGMAVTESPRSRT